MFDSLDDQMKHDRREEKTIRERIIQYTLIALIAIAVFAGVFYGVRMLE